MMINNIDKNTRIVLKWHFVALDYVLALQRKRRYGWKTVSWIYPSIMKNETCEYIRDWLEWNEAYKNGKKTEKDEGMQLMTKGKGKF